MPLFRLGLLTVAAVGIHGYHLGCDDAAIYLPAVKKFIDPTLYPFGSEFFLSHVRFSQFAAVAAATARVTRADGDLVIFLWYVVTVFAMLLATWQLTMVCFHSEQARWAALSLITTLLTIPVAGTALALFDPYLTARSASTPLIVLAVAALVAGKRTLAVLWIALAAIAHPMMATYGVALLGILLFPWKRNGPARSETEKTQASEESSERAIALRAFAVPFGLSFAPISPAYRQVLDMRPFLFLARWTRYEMLGLVAPLAFIFWVGRVAPRGVSKSGIRIANAAAVLGLTATIIAALFSSSQVFDGFARLQPLRALHMVYLIFFTLLGGLLGEYLLKDRRWLWICFFMAIGAGMFVVQRKSYPDSEHIELPWVAPRNHWVAAFLWVRHHTPTDAVFALDPDYIELPGEDQHGFRAIAERSMLTDNVKDSGVVSLFPELAAEWQREQMAQQNWSHFGPADFQRLAERYPVSWVLWDGGAPEGLECPYENSAVAVCRIPGAQGLKGGSGDSEAGKDGSK
jgi:hypothetical protein